MRKRDRARLARGLMLGMTTLCTAALFGAAGSNAVRPLAASTAAAVQAEQGALRGLCVALDAGHGGYDGGAVGRVSGEAEKGLNLDVAIRAKRLLEERGAQVIMTRTGDYALCDEDPPIRKKLQDMQRRARIIGEGRVDIVVSIHMNEYAGRSESGPQVFYREGCPAGRLLAGAVQTAMVEGLQPEKEREALGGDYYILTLGLPSVLVECGFLSNREEEAKLLTPAYREQVAAAIADGLCRWHALPGEKPQPLEAIDRSDEPTGG